VVVILGILGGIALPRFYPQAEKGRVAEAIAMLSAIRQGQEAYRLEESSYLLLAANSVKADWNKIGMENPNDNANKFFKYTVDVSGDTFTAKADRVDGDYLGSTVEIDNNGTWSGNHSFGPGK